MVNGNELSTWCHALARTLGRDGAVAHCEEQRALDGQNAWWGCALTLLRGRRT